MAVSAFTHSCSILNLQEAPVWHFIIDETGSSFSSKVQQLKATDANVGKVVGLLHPEPLKLPQLPHGFHATQNEPAVVHDVINNLLTAKVGLIGCAVTVEELEGYGWINSIRLLTRWALSMLPASGQPVKVKVFVEQRAPYTNGADLRAFAETLQNEMQKLSPSRLNRLKLEFNVIPKTGHPHNGYVDSLAYLWGSPKPENKAFLKKLNLVNTCFMDDDSLFVERLFLLIQHQHKLIAQDWYQLAALPPETYSNTLLSECLATLGYECKNDINRWQQFLKYVRDQQANKNYIAQELFHATNWLATYKPNNLNPLLLLRLLNIQLSANNHLGHVAQDIANSAVKLGQQLFDENAQLSCETALRVVVMHCNASNFTAAQEIADKWLTWPVALTGKQNFGKLLSSKGQISAFLGDISARDYFIRAIDTFQDMLDPEVANAEIKQTSHYLLLLDMDSKPVNEADIMQRMLRLFSAKNELELRRIAADFAHGKQADRFSHYLLLRACVKCPVEFSQVAKAYLSQRAYWKDKQGHPWQLIQVYRSLLLWSENRSRYQKLCADYLEKAAELCQHKNHGGILLTMADVFTTLRAQIIDENANSLTTASVVEQLANKLPFSFH